MRPRDQAEVCPADKRTTVTRLEAGLITMSRNIYEAIRTDKLEEVTIRLNLGEDIDQSFPPRLEPLAVS